MRTDVDGWAYLCDSDSVFIAVICPTCGAVVSHDTKAQHVEWHRALTSSVPSGGGVERRIEGWAYADSLDEWGKDRDDTATLYAMRDGDTLLCPATLILRTAPSEGALQEEGR